MAYNFKNLAEVELLTEMPENASAFIEVNGAVKRVSKESAQAQTNSTIILYCENENGYIYTDENKTQPLSKNELMELFTTQNIIIKFDNSNFGTIVSLKNHTNYYRVYIYQEGNVSDSYFTNEYNIDS